MTPLAELIKDIRHRRGFRQADLAELLGCRPKNISAVEIGAGRGVKTDFVERFCEALNLADDERLRLAEAARRSRRSYAIPDQVPAPVYELVSELFDSIERLTALEVEALRTVLRMHGDRRPAASQSLPRLVRRDKVWKSDAVP